jgi:hypothetical protein
MRLSGMECVQHQDISFRHLRRSPFADFDRKVVAITMLVVDIHALIGCEGAVSKAEQGESRDSHRFGGFHGGILGLV